MKALIGLTVFALTVIAVIAEEQQRVNGLNGWFIPQEDGSFQWINKWEKNEFLNKFEIEGRQDTNKVRFFLLTNENKKKQEEIFANKQSIRSTNFNASNPTRFIIHGWKKGAEYKLNSLVAEGWFSRGEYNIIVVDWIKARTLNYMSACVFVPRVGIKVANMIKLLNTDFGMSLNSLQCIGHSLGAHVCGYAGKNTEPKFHTIVGLDPALPFYDYDMPDQRLNNKDALYVETIQTNGGKLGFSQPIGKCTFYPNGGKKQPGCGMDLKGSCSHARSFIYYATALKLNNFPAIKCPDYKHALQADCDATYGSSRMASDTNYLQESGEHFVPVSSKFPFGLATD